MKKKVNPRLESVLTLAATVAALGTAVGVAPRDLLAAEPAGAVQTEKASAGQVKLRTPANQHKVDAVQQKAGPGAAKPAATQYKLNAGPGATQYKEKMSTPAANNVRGYTIKQPMNQTEGK